jgi:glutamyl-tRNA reductase
VYLYTIDDLAEVIEENRRSRIEAAVEADEIIEYHTAEFLSWLRSLDAVDLIHSYRQRAEHLRDDVLCRALKMLENGKSADEALGFLAHTLTNKLLHAPSSRLRQAGRDGQVELLEAANEIFQLRTRPDKTS